jgi:hypothetical protein
MTKPLVEKPLSEIQAKILKELSVCPESHISGPTLASVVGCDPRTLRAAIRDLRYAHGRWDILSRAGGDPNTDGYWISENPAEIDRNRRYHQRYGLNHLSRASWMSPEKSDVVADISGQARMTFSGN